MAGYHVLRIAVDPLGAPISGTVTCVEHDRCASAKDAEIGPFDRIDEVVEVLCESLDRQLTLW